MVGDKKIICFEVGSNKGRDLQIVDIWLNNEHVTFEDNTAYVPSFVHSLEYELNMLKNKIGKVGIPFLDLGPTTQDCSARIMNKNEHRFNVVYYFDKGNTKLVSLPKKEIIEAYEGIINVLKLDAT